MRNHCHVACNTDGDCGGGGLEVCRDRACQSPEAGGGGAEDIGEEEAATTCMIGPVDNKYGRIRRLGTELKVEKKFSSDFRIHLLMQIMETLGSSATPASSCRPT